MEAAPLVLLVDDDSHALGGYAELLQAQGFRVMVAESADEAVARCEERMPDAVVTDIALPGRDGFDLARDLRMLCSVRELPILAITAFWATDVHERASRAGVMAILAKPCQPDHLVAELRRILRRAASPGLA
jgi:two-component system, cell cycle response regulator DivK